MNDELKDVRNNLREMQLAQIELVKLFSEICEREQLHYFLINGTLLGAVRHKGFIPWDDDVDIGMPRPDYETFLRVADQYLPNDFHLLRPGYTEGYLYYIPRLTCSRKKVKCSIYQTERIEDVSIDICAMDGMPDSCALQYLHEFRILFLHALYKFSVFDQYVSVNNPRRTWYEKILVFLCKRLSLQRLFSTEKRIKAHSKAMQKYAYNECNYVTNFMGAYKLREMFPKKIFGEGKKYDFEGMKLYGPTDADAYLTQLYGDYMTPPTNIDYGKHGFEIVK